MGDTPVPKLRRGPSAQRQTPLAPPAGVLGGLAARVRAVERELWWLRWWAGLVTLCMVSFAVGATVAALR